MLKPLALSFILFLICHSVNSAVLQKDDAILTAVAEGRCENIKDLVDSGVNINFKSEKYGLTALHMAALKKNKQCIKILIEHKADVNISDSRLHTPLDFTHKSDRDSQEILLEAGGERNGYRKKSNIFNSATGIQSIILFPIIFVVSAFIFKVSQKKYSPLILSFGLLSPIYFGFIVFPEIQYRGIGIYSIYYITIKNWAYTIIPVAVLVTHLAKSEKNLLAKKVSNYIVYAYIVVAAISALALIAFAIAISGTS